MKQNKTKLYAKALAEIISGKTIDEKKVIGNFLNLLTKTGQEKKAKEILDLAETIYLVKHGNRRIIFETARKMTSGQVKLMETLVKKGDVVKEKINPELIAGVKIIINNEKQFDNSMLNKLNNIL